MTKDKRFVGFCTIYTKKKNRPLFTFDIMKGFTEGHALALCIMKGGIKDIEKEVYDSLKEYVNQTGEPSERAKKYIDDFEKLHRVMIKFDEKKDFGELVGKHKGRNLYTKRDKKLIEQLKKDEVIIDFIAK